MSIPFAWEDDEDQDYESFGSNRPTRRPRPTLVPQPASSPYDGEVGDLDKPGLPIGASVPRRAMSESYDQSGGIGEEPPPPEIAPRLFDPEEGPRPDEPGVPRKPRTALEDLAAHQAFMPQREKPKWWQRVAAGALGGAAGYLNAGGRNRIDVSSGVEGIYSGGYNRDMANWKNEQAGLTTRAKIEAEQAKEAREKEESAAAISSHRAAEARANRPFASPRPVAPPATYEAKLVRDLESPDPAVRANAKAELDQLKAKPARAPGSQQQIIDQLAAAHMAEGDPEEVARDKAVIEYAKQYRTKTEATAAAIPVNAARVGQIGASTASISTGTGIKSRSNEVKRSADKAIADEKTQDPKLAVKNVLDPRFYSDWDQQMRSEVAAEIQRRMDAKKTPKAGGALDTLAEGIRAGTLFTPKGGTAGNEQPVAPTPNANVGPLNVKLKHPQTGEVKRFMLTPQELQEATSKGFIQVQ